MNIKIGIHPINTKIGSVPIKKSRLKNFFYPSASIDK